MSVYQEKIIRCTKRHKTQFEETEQGSDAEVTGMLKLPS